MTYRRAAIGGAVVLLVVVLVIFRHRLSTDFIPLDRSTVGPNLVAAVIQAVIVGFFTVILYPPWRRAVHRFVDQKLSGIHDKLNEARDHREWEARHLAELYESRMGKPAAPHPHFDLSKKPPGSE